MVEKLSTEITSNHEQVLRLKYSLEEMEKELEIVREKGKEMLSLQEKENSDLKTQLNACRVDINNLKSQKLSLTNTLCFTEEELGVTGMKQELTSKRQELEDLLKALEQKDKILLTITKQVERDMASLIDEINLIKEQTFMELKEKNSQIETLRRTVKKYRAMAATSNSRNAK
eukprot:TRINITY_DN8457_c0_g1_i4.p1 TRINITY_DN8457_c0_g1~~TRINITY_DN8457_c0_g1_i4.p1  ORF type:complete len:173 (+),score=52.65 TRINITY_DN8457_c0_g1_i4:254-772(+)